MRILVQDGFLVNVTKSPIIVSLRDQVIERTRRIIRMSALAAHAGVENADIEGAIKRLRVSDGKIVGNVALPEALAVKRNAKFLKRERLRLARGKHVDTLGHGQTPGD